MQPSQSDIQREFEALRDIRRRSTVGGPGTLILDPDLPNQTPSPVSPLSPQAALWGSGVAESSSSAGGSGSDDPNDALDDPFHLFWVPANVHPELAPAEFRTFLKEHARSPSDGVSLSRSSSASSSSGLGRKRSMLSRQYKPREGDGIEEERVVPLQRRTSQYERLGPQLTISDLQKLEELAEEASKSDDPTKLRRMLRRSLSLNVSPSVIDQMDDIPDPGEDADAPIIVPRPNQILRRAARTKIRKPGLVGDGGGHRFANTRRIGGRSATVDVLPSSDRSSSDHGQTDFDLRPYAASNDGLDDESEENRRNTFSEESSIYDAYARDDLDDKEPYIFAPQISTVSEPLPLTKPEPDIQPGVAPIHHPQPQRQLSAPLPQPPTRTPSPEPVAQSPEPQRHEIHSEPLAFLNAPPPPEKRREKDKKGLLRIWAGDKASKKSGPKEREKEKDSGFFGSLFGGKKKQEDAPSSLGGGAGPATAAALLGASKSSKAYQAAAQNQLTSSYSRYPIHVERAIYRLSHIKLANPRRPLYEQVLISNLMFWYLGVINKTQQGPGQNGQPTTPTQSAPSSPTKANSGSAQATPNGERESLEGRVEKEKPERERVEKEVEKQEPKREQRKGSLTKPPAAGSRRAEMPVKGPQYGLQHQAIEQEYGSAPSPAAGHGAVPVSRTASAPPQVPNYSGRNLPPQSPKQHPPNGNQIQTQSPAYYYPANDPMDGHHPPSNSGRPNTSPGSKPSSIEQTWPSSPTNRNHNAPPPNRSSPQYAADPAGYRRSSRSPPPQNRNVNYEKSSKPHNNGEAKLQGRSLSANAIPPIPNGHGLKKKPQSVGSPNPVTGRPRTREGSNEEEDVPLAVWQQQRRK